MRIKKAQLRVFKEAMLVWESHTCIKFVERRPEHEDYAIFTERSCGCCSKVGRTAGPQAISFSINCTKLGIVLHEFGHLIGFWHEHTRPDRDENVEIVQENIKNDQIHNFDKMNRTEIDSLGSPYDFESIMHYSRNTFTKHAYLDTIRPKNMIENEIGHRIRLSKQDIKQANLLYKCPINGQTIQQKRGIIEFNEYSDQNRVEKDEFYEWRLVAASVSEHYLLKIEEISFNRIENLDCNENYLLILDGYTINSPIIKKICLDTLVTDLPLELNSKTNRVTIIYKKSKQNIGSNLIFKAFYEVQCGGLLTDENGIYGIIQSTSYPLNYDPLSYCEWRIKVKHNHKISLHFERFDLENNANCLTDYLEIREGSNDTGRLISRLCGTAAPNRLQSTTEELFIRFVSDSIIQKTGFNLTYTSDLDECELNMHSCEQICNNMLNGFKCDCLIGFELNQDGKTCVKTCGGMIKIEESGVINSPFYPNQSKNP